MNLYESPRALSALWRRQLAMGLEAGETPVLALGWDTLHPDSLFPLAGLAELARRRPGAVEPQVVAGGEGDLWLLGTTQWQTGRRGTHIRRGGVLYGGNDSATFAASLTLAETPGADLSGPSLPLGMAWLLTPTAAPGAERSEGEYLPFALASDEFSPLPVPPAPTDWLARLEGWAIALLAVGLLVAATINLL